MLPLCGGASTLWRAPPLWERMGEIFGTLDFSLLDTKSSRKVVQTLPCVLQPFRLLFIPLEISAGASPWVRAAEPWKHQAGSNEQESADASAGKNGRFGLTGGTPSRGVRGLRGRAAAFPVPLAIPIPFSVQIPIPLPSRSMEQPRRRRARAPPGGSSGQGNPAEGTDGAAGPQTPPKHLQGAAPGGTLCARVCVCLCLCSRMLHTAQVRPRVLRLPTVRAAFAQHHLSLRNKPKFPPKNSCPGVVAWLESLGQSPQTVTESLTMEKASRIIESNL